MLEVKQVTRSYDDFKAVDNVSFTVGKGEIVGLLGHNGAGKTTIMRMISGFMEPDQGSVIVNGVNLAHHPKSIQAELGYLPELLPVYPELGVADYLDYAAELKGLNGDDKVAEIRRVIRATDLSGKLLATISTLSRGYKQRLGVAQAILGRPKLLILDEPTNGLDPGQTQRMRELIREIATDATIILSTHIMQEVEALCSRALILRAGELALDAKLEDLRRSRHLLLETSLAQSSTVDLIEIKGVDAVHAVEATDNPENSKCYRIALSADANPKLVSAEVAQTLFRLQQTLYRLTPEHRDLEVLFREVNGKTHAQEALSNAA